MLFSTDYSKFFVRNRLQPFSTEAEFEFLNECVRSVIVHNKLYNKKHNTDYAQSNFIMRWGGLGNFEKKTLNCGKFCKNIH